MDTVLMYTALIILSVVALVAIVGAFGLKFFVRREDKKFEVIISDHDNSKN